MLLAVRSLTCEDAGLNEDRDPAFPIGTVYVRVGVISNHIEIADFNALLSGLVLQKLFSKIEGGLFWLPILVVLYVESVVGLEDGL